MMNLKDIQEFINNAPGNIIGTIDNPKYISCDMLSDIPHRYASDLVVKYWLQVETDNQIAQLLIDNDLARYLGYTEEYLYYYACKNIGEPVVKSLLDMLNSMTIGNIEFTDADNILHVITNSSMRYGSFYLCMPDILDKIADEHDSDLLIIPSSKHELLYLKYNETSIPIHTVKQIVYMINRIELDPKDILSDSVYIWNRETKKITIY